MRVMRPFRFFTDCSPYKGERQPSRGPGFRALGRDASRLCSARKFLCANGALSNDLSDLPCRVNVTRGGAGTGASSSQIQGVRQRMTGIDESEPPGGEPELEAEARGSGSDPSPADRSEDEDAAPSERNPAPDERGEGADPSPSVRCDAADVVELLDADDDPGESAGVKRKATSEAIDLTGLSSSDEEEDQREDRVTIEDSPPRPPPVTRGEIKCAVCLDSARDLASTVCGHVFCVECIEEALEHKPRRCPTCRKHLRPTQYHRLFL